MKRKNKTDIDDLRAEYDFSKLKSAVKGKYAARYRAGTNLVHLEPDVARVFADDESVNQALRSLMRLAKIQATLG